MGKELLEKWIEKAASLGLSPDVVSSMQAGWESSLSELEVDLGQSLHADISSQILPMDDPDELDIGQKQRMADALELGLDLSTIEALNAAERMKGNDEHAGETSS